MNNNGVLVSASGLIVGIVGFIYTHMNYEYMDTLTTNNIAANLVYTPKTMTNWANYRLIFAIIAIVFFILLIYFIRKN